MRKRRFTMKTHLKLLALFLMLLMLVQSAIVTVFAIAPVDGEIVIYAASGTQPTKYSKQYNSGQRNVVATTLDGTSADDYYSGSYEYDTLSTKSSTEIKNSLSTLMKSTHSYQSSYNDCHYKADRTDCQNEDGSVSLIYTNYSATMGQWNGWNREHVWPQSLGGGNTSGGGADLHHVRPSDASVNSSRGNKKYGNTNGGTAKYGANPATGYIGGYYNNTYFEPVDSVKGDVARIVLYVWVRWGTSWGADSVTEVFQSVEVLLEWCELDPVDTWELGRNEVVQDIQGNRNVFIDYPEYAWLIFDKKVPEDMVTPSGEASEGSCSHSWSVTYTDATCTTNGTKVSTCTICDTVKTETTTSAFGHSFVENVTTPATCTTSGTKTSICSKCNTTKTETIKATGHSYGDWVIDKNATETETGEKHRVCGTCNNTETVAIPELGHEHSYTSVVTAPTCTEKGFTTYTCSCGETKVDDFRDRLDHSYSNGTCSRCGAIDPSAPTVTADDFNNIVTQLFAGIYTGKDRYVKICEAINIYNNLSINNQASVSDKYAILKNIVAQYNTEAADTNTDSKPMNNTNDELIITVALAVSNIPLAAYSLSIKKDF